MSDNELDIYLIFFRISKHLLEFNHVNVFSLVLPMCFVVTLDN